MRPFIPFYLAVLLSFGVLYSCRNLSTRTKNADPQHSETHGPAGWRASHVIEGNNPDSAPTVQVGRPPARVHVPVDALPPASASRRAYLATGWWHLNMAFQPSDTLVHEHYQSKWLRFREDQTFDVLIRGKVVDTGRWNWDESKNELYLSCADVYINNSWKVIDKGFVMIWMGNTQLNVTGIQVRVANARSEPKFE